MHATTGLAGLPANFFNDDGEINQGLIDAFNLPIRSKAACAQHLADAARRVINQTYNNQNPFFGRGTRSIMKNPTPSLGRKRRARRARGRRLEAKALRWEKRMARIIAMDETSNKLRKHGELSFYYRAQIEHMPGVTPDGEEYKAIVRSMRPVSAGIFQDCQNSDC